MKICFLHRSTFPVVAIILGATSARAVMADDIRIKVLSPEGKAVAGAQVIVTPYKRQRILEAEKELTAKTDAQGGVSFDLKRPSLGVAVYGNVFILGQDGSSDGGELKAGDNVFQLLPATPIDGKVLDGGSQPVNEANIKLTSVVFGASDYHKTASYIRIPASLISQFSAKSNAQGKWVLPSVPGNAELHLELADSRFVTERSYRQADDRSNIVFTAVPGATVSGRVIDTGGKPVPNVAVSASQGTAEGRLYGTSSSDEDGKYTISGLPPVEVLRLGVDSQPGATLVASGMVQSAAVPSQVSTAPDITMVPGVVIEGLIKDVSTGKPLPNANVFAIWKKDGQIAGVGRAESGDDGRFQVRTLTGEVTLSATMLDYSNKGVGTYGSPLQVTVKETGNPTPTISLKPFDKIEGIVVDQKGEAIPNAPFRLGQQWSKLPIEADGKGKWSAIGNDEGVIYLSGGAGWALVEPKQIKLPADKPVKVVLRPITFAKVGGRVVTPDGRPLANAKVTLSSSKQDGDHDFEKKPLVVNTGADGNYAFTTMPSDERPFNVNVKLNKYMVVTTPQFDGFKKEGEAWKVNDVVMASFGPAVKGQVLSADGRPVKGAFVVADRGPTGMLETGDDGSFTLDKLLEGKAAITAFTGNTGVTTEITLPMPGDDFTLVLKERAQITPGNAQFAYGILENLLKNTDRRRFWSHQMAFNLLDGFDDNLAKKLRGDATPMNSETDRIFQEIVAEPEKAVLRIDEYVGKMEKSRQKPFRAYLEAAKGLGVAETDKPLAEKLLTSSEATLRSIPAAEREEANHETIMAYAMTGALASRLEKPSASSWCDLAMTIVERMGTDKRGMGDGFHQLLLNIAARGGEANFDLYTEDVAPVTRILALSDIIERLSKTNPEEALRWLKKLEEAPEPEAGTVENYSRGDKKQALNASLLILVKAFAPKNPAQALVLARRVDIEGQRSYALTMAASGAKGEEQDKLFREAYAATNGWGQHGKGYVAAMAYNANPDLGKTFFDKLLVEVEQQKRRNSENIYSDLPEIAYYLARYVPIKAREIIEGNFALQKARFQPGMSYEMQISFLAMAPVDLERALEMARSIVDDQGNSPEISLAAFALASEKERREVSFEDLRSGRWQPLPPVAVK